MKKIHFIIGFIFLIVTTYSQMSHPCIIDDDSVLLEQGCTFILSEYFVTADSFDEMLKIQLDCEANSIYDFLKKHPSTIIEIGCYSDPRGDSPILIKETQNRAQKLKQLTVLKGIDSTRIYIKGYGSYSPRHVTQDLIRNYQFLKDATILDSLFINTLTSKDQQEMAYYLNRRTEIKIIRY